MPPLRLHPLLVAGAACLTLAACGSDDDPPAPQANAPAKTESAAPTETTPTQPATTDSASATSDRKDSERTTDKNGADEPSGTSATAKIRDTLVSLQEAFAAKDGKKACSLMIGIPEKADPKSPGLSCESLGQGPRSTLSAENRKLAENAKVTINGNEAQAELAPGVPFTLRKVDGRWRVDYSQMGRASAGSR